MRRGFGFIGLVVTVVLLAIVGVIAYNVGWSDGLATHVPAGTAEVPAYYYGYGPHAFWGGFGILWFLFGLFFLFFLLRVAFFGRRHWGGGWGGGHKSGYGHGPSHATNELDERMHEWHRRAHGEQPPAATTTPPPPPPDQRSV